MVTSRSSVGGGSVGCVLRAAAAPDERRMGAARVGRRVQAGGGGRVPRGGGPSPRVVVALLAAGWVLAGLCVCALFALCVGEACSEDEDEHLDLEMEAVPRPPARADSDVVLGRRRAPA